MKMGVNGLTYVTSGTVPGIRKAHVAKIEWHASEVDRDF